MWGSEEGLEHDQLSREESESETLFNVPVRVYTEICLTVYMTDRINSRLAWTDRVVVVRLKRIRHLRLLHHMILTPAPHDPDSGTT